MALKTQLGQRWLAGWIVSSVLKSHNHSHPATARWGGKLRKGQARALDWSRGSARFNIAPLTCSCSVQTPFRQSFFGFQEWQQEEQQFYTANNFLLYRDCARDEGWQHQKYLHACFCLQRATAAVATAVLWKATGVWEQSKTGWTFLGSPTDLLIFSQGSWDMFPLWAYKRFSPEKGWFTWYLWRPGHG